MFFHNRRGITTSLVLVTVMAACGFKILSAAQKHGQIATPSQQKITVMNDPDRFAWELFIEINKPIEQGSKTATWEAWAEQEEVYCDPNRKPVWPSHKGRHRSLHPITQFQLRPKSAHLPLLPPDRSPTGEEVRINKPAFEYIVGHNLWFQQGVIATAAESGITFPSDSIAIKAVWSKIDPKDKDRYHWDEYRDLNTDKPIFVGLVALHITSKAIPNWHWATFEHMDNAGFADYIGAHDSYGMNPPIVHPHVLPNKGYSTQLKKKLLRQMKNAAVGSEWQYYRLKGSQVNFTDSTGRPTLLGNSITEAGFVSTASCITCHAKASAHFNSDNPPKYIHLPIFKSDGQSDNGVPNPDWFWYFTPKANLPIVPESRFYQVDFLWQLGRMPKKRG